MSEDQPEQELAEIKWDDLYAFMDELRQVAEVFLIKEGSAQSITPTGLILTALRRQKRSNQDWSEVTWANRAYFFGSMREAMRRALVDHARKRKGDRQLKTVPMSSLPFTDLPELADKYPDVFLALDEALAELKNEDAELANVIECRFFTGLTIKQTASFLGIAEKTVSNRDKRALALLRTKIEKKLREEGSL